MGLGSVGPMLRVVNKEESFKKEELRNWWWDRSEGSNEAFGYAVATCDPWPEQIQEGLVMKDLSWSAPQLWARMVGHK